MNHLSKQSGHIISPLISILKESGYPRKLTKNVFIANCVHYVVAPINCEAIVNNTANIFFQKADVIHRVLSLCFLERQESVEFCRNRVNPAQFSINVSARLIQINNRHCFKIFKQNRHARTDFIGKLAQKAKNGSR